MTISDPLLRRKLNQFQQTFGLAKSFEWAAMRMREQASGNATASLLAFENGSQKKFFEGFLHQGQSIPGFSEMVLSYFRDFPRNLYDGAEHDLAQWLEQGIGPILDGARMHLNQAHDVEGDLRESTLHALERDIRFIQETESQRVFTVLGEIRQRRTYAELDVPKKKGLEKVVELTKTHPLAVAIILAVLALKYVSETMDYLSKIFCEIFRIWCGT